VVPLASLVPREPAIPLGPVRCVWYCTHVRREAIVPLSLTGQPLDQAVRTLFDLSWGKARAAVETGKVSVNGATVTDILRYVRTGGVLVLDPNARRPRPEVDLPYDAIVHLDTHVVVVNKPSGISTVPFDEEETGTLDTRVRAWLARRQSGSRSQPHPLGIVHRIDKDTSGLVVFTRTWLAKQSLSAQFRAHTVHRRYLALVHGTMTNRTFRTHLLENRGDGLRGSYEARARKGPKEGQLAVTHVEVLEVLDGATLVACQLETGRTHQIRIHLSEAGHPLLGERVYIRGYQGHEIPAPRLMLHAAELGFTHPKSEEPVRWESPMPPDMRETLERL